MTTGAGGTTYRVCTSEKSYVLKLAKEDAMNHPRLEPTVCAVLRSNGINTLCFVPSKDGEYSTLLDGYIANLYEYVEGDTVAHNSLSAEKVDECAALLAKINVALQNMDLPMGLSQGFFDFMTPDRALQSYLQSLEKAREIKDAEIIRSIENRIELLPYIHGWQFDCAKLTFCNSHGDYTNNQLILQGECVHIIDFTCCCRQPVVWELTRFFFHADKTAKDGAFDEKRYREYLRNYTSIVRLTDYDLDNAYKLYFYQILVCDYYSQYLAEKDDIKKKDYLTQANFASKILNANSELIKNAQKG